MLSLLFRSLLQPFRRWKPLTFSNTNFTRISTHMKIEEETIPRYIASRYYPARIGEIFQDRYQVVGKLGYGSSSTTWLTRDLSSCQYVTLKLYINSISMGKQLDRELNTYKRIEISSKYHPGSRSVRSLLNSFEIEGPEGQHRCLVHHPLWDSVLTFLHRNPMQRLPAPVLAFVLKRLFLALDYLHTKCQIVHTDLKADNIMLGIADDSVFTQFEEEEFQKPSARKEVDGRTIYLSRDLRMPKDMDVPVLCDFGSAMPGGVEHLEDIQPDIYRAPEVILESGWTYSADIWNVGCMIWDVFEGGHLFTGQDPELKTYRGRAHIAEMIALLGPPPSHLVARGNLSSKFFSGDYCGGIPLPNSLSLEERETTLKDKGDEREAFLRLMRKMLQWDPDKRSSAKELVEDEWIQQYTRV